MGLGVLDANGRNYTLVACETIQVSSTLSLPERLKKIYQALREFIERYQPTVLALENVFFAKDIRATVKIGEARACAMLAAAERGIPVVEYPPARVKQAVSGNGRATKTQVQQMIRHLLRLKEAPPPDASDALAVALCHFQTDNVRLPRR
jgi:crossover junction endodeoxyribonuclease RuvC